MLGELAVYLSTLELALKVGTPITLAAFAAALAYVIILARDRLIATLSEPARKDVATLLKAPDLTAYGATLKDADPVEHVKAIRLEMEHRYKRSKSLLVLCGFVLLVVTAAWVADAFMRHM